MVAINIKAFRGEVPRISDRLLQPNQATRAQNCKITSGRLDPVAGLSTVYSINMAIRTLVKYRAYVNSQPIDNWLTWAEDVDFVRSPLANDGQGKFYYTSDVHEPRMSTYAAAIQTGPYPSAWYALGVPSPTTAPSVSVTGGVAPTETRAYAYTFVTALGEESGPSPASAIVTGNANGTWNLTNLQTAPPNSGTISAATVIPSLGRVRVTLNTTFGLEQWDTITIAGVAGMTDLNGSRRIVNIDKSANWVEVELNTAQTYTSGGTWTRNAPHNTTGMTKRIYRSAGTGANFLFVAEISAATTTYADSIAAANLGEVIATTNTLPPPKNLTSLISLPNGCMAGLADNQLCFSDPYMPYSWPESNRYSFSGRGVALTAAGNSVVVLTDSFPILFVGSDPEAMSPNVMETYAPCVSKRGVANVGGGCLYPSFDGLWLASPGRVENLTKKLYREEEWSALNPASFTSAFHDGKYHGFYDNALGTRRTLIIDPQEADSIIEVDEYADALYRNEYDGQLYVTHGGDVRLWEAYLGRPYTSDWISATYQLGRPTNFAVAQVHAKFADIVPPDTAQIAANETLITAGADAVAGHLGGHELLAFEIAGSYIVPAVVDAQKKVQFTLYKDGEPVYTRGVTSSTPFRLPAGYRSEVFNVGIQASVSTYSVTIAESTAELAQAS